jgi:ABC-2 type transport system permease protein/oleandomycin transport system permease protein
MTAIAINPPSDAPGPITRARFAVSDTLTISRRNLLVWLRVPAYIVFTVIQPVIFVLMFRYVFGGAIKVDVPGGYVNFLMPGILAQTAAFACFGTAISLAQELKKGVIDRFRSMPMARSAVLGGRLVADTGRMTVTILIVIGVGYAVGFRTFLSSAFVPISTMPGWLQAFANNQPLTFVIDAMRGMALGGPIATPLWKATAWLVGIFVVFTPLAVRAYKRAA